MWRNLIGTVETVFKIGLNRASLDAGALTAPRNYTLPNLSGTLALTSQLGGGGGVTISPTAPVAPVNGQEWQDTNSGIKYTYIVDADSSQWVELGPSLLAAAGAAVTSGVATIDFGPFPGAQEASVTITGQTGITSNSIVRVFVSANDSTASHTAADHSYLPLLAHMASGAPTAGAGFPIYARSMHKLQGQFKVRWAW